MASGLAALEAEARALGRPFNRPETRPRRGFKDADYENAPYWDEQGNFVQPWVPQEPPPIPEPKAGEEVCNGKPSWATKRFASWASRRSTYDFQKAEARRARGEPAAYPRLNLDGTPYTKEDEQELQFWRDQIEEIAERKSQGLVDPWDEALNSSDEEHISVCHGGRYKGPVGKIHPDGFLYVVEQEGAEDSDEPVEQDGDEEEEDTWVKHQPKARAPTRRAANPPARRARSRSRQRSSSTGAQARSSSAPSTLSGRSTPTTPSTLSGRSAPTTLSGRPSVGQVAPKTLSGRSAPSTLSGRRTEAEGQSQTLGDGLLASKAAPQSTGQLGAPPPRRNGKPALSQPAEQQKVEECVAPEAEGKAQNKAKRKRRHSEPAHPAREGTTIPMQQAIKGAATPMQQARDVLHSPPSHKSPRDWLSAMLEQTAKRHSGPGLSPHSPSEQAPLECPCAPASPPASPPPKRPKNAYQLFLAEEKMTSVHRNSLSRFAAHSDETALPRTFAHLWKELPPAVRKAYEEQAADLRREFLTKQAAHEAGKTQRCHPERTDEQARSPSPSKGQKRVEQQAGSPSPAKGQTRNRTPERAKELRTPTKSIVSPEDHPLAKLLKSPRLQLPKTPPLSAPMTPPEKVKGSTLTANPGRKSRVRCSSANQVSRAATTADEDMPAPMTPPDSKVFTAKPGRKSRARCSSVNQVSCAVSSTDEQVPAPMTPPDSDAFTAKPGRKSRARHSTVSQVANSAHSTDKQMQAPTTASAKGKRETLTNNPVRKSHARRSSVNQMSHSFPTNDKQVPAPISPPAKRKRETLTDNAGQKSRTKLSTVGPDTRTCEPKPVMRRRSSIKAPQWRLWPTRRRIRFKSPPTAEWRAWEASRQSHKNLATSEEHPQLEVVDQICRSYWQSKAEKKTKASKTHDAAEVTQKFRTGWTVTIQECKGGRTYRCYWSPEGKRFASMKQAKLAGFEPDGDTEE